MRLYDTRLAPNPARVRWVMAEKGIDGIEIVQISLIKGEQKSAAYTQKTGGAEVPALELDDGAVLTESIAICRYLESLYPEPNLFGYNPLEVAMIEIWTRRAELTLATPLMLTVRHTHPAMAAIETQSADVASFYRRAADTALQVFDRRLSDSEFIAGGRLGMADIVAICALDFSRLIKFEISESFGNVRRWAAEMRARPAAGALRT